MADFTPTWFSTTGRISEVALLAGFSNVAHFNRLFHSRYGDTPTGIRSEQ
jgi:transcriptional regulator GlxA family with amidase domain